MKSSTVLDTFRERTHLNYAKSWILDNFLSEPVPTENCQNADAAPEIIWITLKNHRNFRHRTRLGFNTHKKTLEIQKLFKY